MLSRSIHIDDDLCGDLAVEDVKEHLVLKDAPKVRLKIELSVHINLKRGVFL